MIELSNLTKTYPGLEGGQSLTILDGVDLKIDSGSSAAIVGLPVRARAPSSISSVPSTSPPPA